MRISLGSTMTQSPHLGSYNCHNVTQGSQSLALGLALVAAPQLVELSNILSPFTRFPVLFAPSRHRAKASV